MKKWLMNILFIVLFVILVSQILIMPSGLGVNSPSYHEVTMHYIENAIEETGANNIISAILADYRGFDTLGETIVLFISTVAVASILKPVAKYEDEKKVTKDE
jgi:multicomponent Na+:H+ antiporter subunit B